MTHPTPATVAIDGLEIPCCCMEIEFTDSAGHCLHRETCDYRLVARAEGREEPAG